MVINFNYLGIHNHSQYVQQSVVVHMNTSQEKTDITGSNSDLSEARCECGQLVAKLGVRSVELKCKRCKRLVSIPFSTLLHSDVTVTLCSDPPALRTSS